MTLVVVVDDAVGASELAALREGASSSPFVGDSTLDGSFEATRGFAVTFHAERRAEVEQRFPFIAPFLRTALDDKLHAEVRKRRLFERLRAPNVFFLNLLVVPPGAGVERHVDATLADKDSAHKRIPVAVGVLYVDVPAGMRGGRLILDEDGRPLGAVEPQDARFVLFAGHVAHAVEPVEVGSVERPRTSWVLEQYLLGEEDRRTLPALRVHSRAGFEAYLADARRRHGPGQCGGQLS